MEEKKTEAATIEEEKQEGTEDDGSYEKVCYICRRPESKAGPMVSMPGGISMCNSCMQKAFDAINQNGLDFSKLSSMPFLNLNYGDISSLMQPDAAVPKKQKIKKKSEAKKTYVLKDIPAPHVIKQRLDEYVIGQDKAKKVMAVAVYNHYKRALLGEQKGVLEDVTIEKSNILMLGPTGSGKTYMVKTLARLLDVPLAIADATSLTEAGYIGDDIESVVSKLLAAAGNDVERAERGIIFIDEIDKIAKKQQTNARDVSGESVQQELLKLLEGSIVEVPVGSNQKNAMTPMATVNTENILFICGGAFPELENMMKRILTEPKNAILKQYEKLLAYDEVKLVFEDEALDWIAEQALGKETGARALRAIIEEFMLDIMFEIPKDANIGKVIITRPYLEKRGGPRIEMRG